MSSVESRTARRHRGDPRIGKAIALRLVRRRSRIALGYLRNDAAAEPAEETSGCRRRASPGTGNVASDQVIAEFVPWPLRGGRAQRCHGRDQTRTRDRGQALGLDAECQCPRPAVTRARVCTGHGERLVDRRDLLARRASRPRELRAGRRVQGRARVRRALSGRRARAPRHPCQRGLRGRCRDRGARPFPNREQMLRSGNTRTPAGRLVEPGDIAGAVAFLCSPDAPMVCGHTLIVDGGYSLLA